MTPTREEWARVLAGVAWQSRTRPTLSDFDFFRDGFVDGYTWEDAEVERLREALGKIARADMDTPWDACRDIARKALAATGADLPRPPICGWGACEVRSIWCCIHCRAYRCGEHLADHHCKTGADAPRAEDCPDCDGTGYIDVDRGCGQPPDRDVCSTCEGLPRAEAGEEPWAVQRSRPEPFATGTIVEKTWGCADCGATTPGPIQHHPDCPRFRAGEEPGGRRCGTCEGTGDCPMCHAQEDYGCIECYNGICPDCRGEGVSGE